MENKRSKIIIVISILLLIFTIATILSIMLKHNNVSDIAYEENNILASDISNKYEDIDYGEEKEINSDLTISEGGIYSLSGEYECIKVASNDNVRIILNNASIKCSNGPAINVLSSDILNIRLVGNNTLESKTSSSLDGAIYSKSDLYFDGEGVLNITSNYDGIVSKDSLIIKEGNYIINSSGDGIKGKDSVSIVGGNYNITSLSDGIKSSNDEEEDKGFIVIDGGVFDINSKNDGIQASTTLYINNGVFNIKTLDGYLSKTNEDISAKGIKADKQIIIKSGTFDINSYDDSIHSNENISIYNGVFDIKTSDDAIHADSTLKIINGSINIIESSEGLEASSIEINGGSIIVKAYDDAINANGNDSNEEKTKTSKFTNMNGKITITGGEIDLLSYGDALDCNGNIEIKGGKVYIQSQNNMADSPLDHNGTFYISGGEFISIGNIGAHDNGEILSSIPMLIVTLNEKQSGDVKISNISYTPKINNYRQVIIASTKLKPSSTYTLITGNTKTDVTLAESGITTYGNTQNEHGRPNN